ncbi:MAG: GC-type dockerin domain-anchored protein [Planctomycetota bacterium]
MPTRSARAAALAAAILPVLASAALAQPSCPADLDGDGELTALDFLAFQTLFDAEDPAADFDGDGRLLILDFLAYLNAFNAGCPGEPIATQLAGVALDAYPHFQYVRAFNAGDVVRVSIDPDRFPAIRGVTADIYLVAARSADEWASDPTLADVRPSGPQEHAFLAASVEDAAVALAASELLAAGTGLAISGGYDVVIDADRDGLLGAGDFIDGLGSDDQPPERGFSVYTDLTQPGPLTPTTVDTSTIRGDLRLTYPAEIASAGPLPLVVIAHGGGHDFRWYDYLQDHLSSWGWITVSTRNFSAGTGLSMLLQTETVIETQATLAGGVLDGFLDDSRIAWIGHSAGGREAVIGAERLHTGDFVPRSYGTGDIVLLSAIAANSVGDFARIDGDPGPITFHMMWGAADGDITGRPAEQTVPFRHYDRARGVKHSTYIHGADHNDFNCCGFDDFAGPPATEIGRAESQRIAQAIYLALLKHHAEGDADAIDYLTRPWEQFRPASVSPGTTVVHMHRSDPVAAASGIIDDFQRNPSTTTSSSGGAVSIGVDNLVETKLSDTDGSFTWSPTSPANGMTYAFTQFDRSRGAIFDFDGAGFLEFAITPDLADATGYDHLSFRACQGTRHPLTTADLGDVDLTVSIIDGDRRSGSIRISAYGGGIEEPYQRTGAGDGTGWQNEFETVRIRLTDFLAGGTQVDLSNLAVVRFDFGPDSGAARGRLGLDDIEFVADR